MQPDAPLSRRALRKVPLWAQKAMGLDKHLAHREIMEIPRMFRASQAAGEDARPRIVTMGDAMQVVLPLPSLRVSIIIIRVVGRMTCES